jgi:hypothetical protein
LAHSRTRQSVAVALAGAIGFAYVQVAAAPPAQAPPVPTMGAVVDHVRTELAWLRTALPHEAGWWTSTYSTSSENLRNLTSLLSGGGTGSSAR